MFAGLIFVRADIVDAVQDLPANRSSFVSAAAGPSKMKGGGGAPHPGDASARGSLTLDKNKEKGGESPLVKKPTPTLFNRTIQSQQHTQTPLDDTPTGSPWQQPNGSPQFAGVSGMAELEQKAELKMSFEMAATAKATTATATAEVLADPNSDRQEKASALQSQTASAGTQAHERRHSDETDSVRLRTHKLPLHPGARGKPAGKPEPQGPAAASLGAGLAAQSELPGAVPAAATPEKATPSQPPALLRAASTAITIRGPGVPVSPLVGGKRQTMAFKRVC